MGVLARGMRRPAARREGEEAAGRVEERSRRRRRPCSGSGSSSRPPASGTRCACPSSAGTSGAGFVSGAKADFFFCWMFRCWMGVVLLMTSEDFRILCCCAPNCDDGVKRLWNHWVM
jgi:hypothetical protein